MTFLALQPLSLDLLPAALALDQRCFGGLWTLDGYRRELESPNSELLVFVPEAEGSKQEAEGKINATPITRHSDLPIAPTPHSPLPTPLIGLGCYWAILEEAHITMLAIDPACQRQGLGQALLYALMVSAHHRGLERATLEVRLSNHVARSLYQKFDFCEAGRRRRYYPDNGEDALVLWRGGLQAPEFSTRLAVWRQQMDDRLQEAGWRWDVQHEHSVLKASHA